MENASPQPQPPAAAPPLPRCCSIRFRPGDQPTMAVSRIDDLRRDEVVMVQTDHGLEPARVLAHLHPCPPEQPGKNAKQGEQTSCQAAKNARNEKDSAGAAAKPAAEDGDENREKPEKTEKAGSQGGRQKERQSAPSRPTPTVLRRASREEQDKYQSLQDREKDDFRLAQKLINKHRLPMKLIKAERFFNGSKVIFYFTAENRVDFRELVKDMVQEFRTRVEIRQVGVRHETKMIGGLGCCGRELCCSSYINQFAPVSIKMAKEQGLPLNPAKISGVCNRLLCCLTYEFETYQQLRRQMPKSGKMVQLDGRTFKVTKVNVLEENVEVCDSEEPGRTIVWQASEWHRCTPARPSDKPAPETSPSKGGERRKGERQRSTPPPRSKQPKKTNHHGNP